MSDLLGVKTLYLIATGSALLLALAMHLLHRLQANSPGVVSWKLGSAVSAAGFCLVALRGVVPDMVSIVLANGLAVLGTAQLQRGFREALDEPPRIALERWATAIAVVGCAFFAFVMPDVSMRVRLVSLLYAGLFTHAAFTLLGRRAVEDPNRMAWCAAGLVVAATAVVHVWRIATYPQLPPGHNYLAVRSNVELLLLLMVPVQCLTLMFALTFIVGWRMVNTLQRSEASQRSLVERLQASERQLQTLVAQAPMAIAMLDAELRYLATSQQWLSQFAGGALSVLGLRPADLRAQQPPHWPGVYRRVLAGETLSAAAEPWTRDGEPPRWFNWTATPWHDPAGRVGGLIMSVEEVTGRERAVQALLESNTKFASVFQTGLLAMAIAELPSGRLVEANDALLGLIGYTREQVLGRTSGELGLWADPEYRAEAMQRLVREGRQDAVEQRLRRADGQLLDVLFAAKAFDTADGRLYVGMMADVTALKSAQRSLEARQQDLEQVVAQRTRELAQARDAAEAASRAKSAFLANMSHEIRTPLNGILGMAYLVQQAGVSDTQRHQLERLEGAGRHLLQVISDVLDLSKIEAGGLVLEERSFTAAELEALVSAVIAPLAQARQLQLDIDFSGLPATLVGDSARLAQALINLLSNGVKFTEVGFVRLETHSRTLPGQRSELRFTVTDSGIGISAEQLARLFQPFAQADSSVTRRYDGTGLGLAISQRLAHMMGGAITVASQPDAGSAFTLTVVLDSPPTEPLATPTRAATAEQLRQLEARLQAAYAGRTLLVVEDDSLSRRYLCDLLTDFGLSVEAAANGREATALCTQRHQPYAVVLMDLHMPELGGLEAARLIRAQPVQARTPIVAVTADTSTAQRQACLDEGFTAVLHKPLVPMSLFAVLAELGQG